MPSRSEPSAHTAAPTAPDRRTLILNAARRRLADFGFGFGATTVRQIADDFSIGFVLRVIRAPARASAPIPAPHGDGSPKPPAASAG